LNACVAVLLSPGGTSQIILKGCAAAMRRKQLFRKNNVLEICVNKKNSMFFDKRNCGAFPQAPSSFMLLA
jgi:hypothetical protein